MTTERQPRLDAAPIKDTTRVGYMKSVMAALRYSRAKRTVDWEEPASVTITQVAEDLAEREDLTQGTKLVARAALLWFIKSGQVEANEDTLRGMTLLENMTAPQGRKPLAKRSRTICEEDLSKLLDEIYDRANNSVWARRCAAWIHAGLATGARPIEWLHAEWTDEEKTTLRIRSAKVKLLAPAFLRKGATEEPLELENLEYWNLEENESLREIPLIKEGDRSMVENQLYYINQFIPAGISERGRREEFAKYHQECAKVLYRACKKIWGDKKSFSLYTMRGQFSANMKAIHGSEITATLMGHASEDSPSTGYYGKANQAHKSFKAQKESQRNKQIQANHVTRHRNNGDVE